MFYKNSRGSKKFKAASIISLIIFTLNFVTLPLPAFGQSYLDMPEPGKLLEKGAAYQPVTIRGVNVFPDDPLKLSFILDTGDSLAEGAALENESTRLVKYFLTALTVPEDEMWVNLSPYEKDRIIPDRFGQTEMGQDLLSQDYILKQMSASLTYPEKKLGKEFWKRVYSQALALYGTTDIPVNTFNKIWIVPEEASIYEHENGAFIVKCSLNVMLEEDYLAMETNAGHSKHGLGVIDKNDLKAVSDISLKIIRELIIPELKKEVNESETFAKLRQIYSSVVLAAWYKEAVKESLLGKIYVNRNKTSGIESADPEADIKIYNQYVEALKKGVFDLIKEDYEPESQQVVHRKYFSGGLNLGGTRGYDSGITTEQARQAVTDTQGRYVPVNIVNFRLIGTTESPAQLADAASLTEARGTQPGITKQMANMLAAPREEQIRPAHLMGRLLDIDNPELRTAVMDLGNELGSPGFSGRAGNLAEQAAKEYAERVNNPSALGGATQFKNIPGLVRKSIKTGEVLREDDLAQLLRTFADNPNREANSKLVYIANEADRRAAERRIDKSDVVNEFSRIITASTMDGIRMASASKVFNGNDIATFEMSLHQPALREYVDLVQENLGLLENNPAELALSRAALEISGIVRQSGGSINSAAKEIDQIMKADASRQGKLLGGAEFVTASALEKIQEAQSLRGRAVTAFEMRNRLDDLTDNKLFDATRISLNIVNDITQGRQIDQVPAQEYREKARTASDELFKMLTGNGEKMADIAGNNQAAILADAADLQNRTRFTGTINLGEVRREVGNAFNAIDAGQNEFRKSMGRVAMDIKRAGFTAGSERVNRIGEETALVGRILQTAEDQRRPLMNELRFPSSRGLVAAVERAGINYNPEETAAQLTRLAQLDFGKLRIRDIADNLALEISNSAVPNASRGRLTELAMSKFAQARLSAVNTMNRNESLAVKQDFADNGYWDLMDDMTSGQSETGFSSRGEVLSSLNNAIGQLAMLGDEAERPETEQIRRIINSALDRTELKGLTPVERVDYLAGLARIGQEMRETAALDISGEQVEITPPTIGTFNAFVESRLAERPSAKEIKETAKIGREVGGIDLNPNVIKMDIQGGRGTFALPLTDETIKNLDVTGFVPELINMTVDNNLMGDLGL